MPLPPKGRLALCSGHENEKDLTLTRLSAWDIREFVFE